MHLSKHQLAILAIIINTIIWSAASPIFKWALTELPPFTFAFLRFLIAALIMFPFVYKRIKIKFEDFYKLFILALAGMTLNISLFFLGLTLTQSINVPIIASTMPFMLVVGSLLFLHEVPKPKEILGILVSLIGVLIIVLRPTDHLSLFSSVLGNIYLILSVVALVAYTILLKRFKLPYASSTIIFWIFFISSITFFPLFMIEAQKTNILNTLDFKGTFGVIYGALFSSTLGYYFYNYAAKYLKADEIGIFTYLEPVATAMVAIPLLHEKITFYYLIGSFFVFLGLFIAELRLHYHPFHHLKETDDPWLESGP
jgi:drug/metabolite transporter (DMT)-like permease